MGEQSGRKGGRDSEDLHLNREEAELLGLDRPGRDRSDERRYPHEHPEPPITEDAVVRDLGADDRSEQREDVDEAFTDAMDQVGTEDDPETPKE